MCIAVVGKILEIEDSCARVDCMGNRMRIELGLVDAKVGDQVLIHAGCAIQVVSEGEAVNIHRLFEEISDAMEEYKN